MKNWRSLLFFPLLIVGIVIFMGLQQNRAEPQRKPPSENAISVRVMEAQVMSVIPRALGYGQVQPGKVWDAVAQVSGKVISINPRLKKGALLKIGTELLRIDDSDYKLALAKAEADLQGLEAQFAESEAREANTRAALKIEQKALVLAQRELKRLRSLGTSTSRSAVEQQERQVLSQRQSIQSLQNTLALLPAERKLLKANQASAQVQLETAKLNLERCVIRLPMNARITAVNVETTQFAQQGKVLVNADGIEVAEINAQIAISQVGHLLPNSFATPPNSEMEDIIKQFGLSATVRLLNSGFQAAEWAARLTRASESEDPQTRTRGFIVAVDKPYQQIEVGKRPPLIRNTFVEVELRGQAKTGIPIPRSALHSGNVYLADQENRLQLRPVTTAFVQGDMAVIKEGLNAGDQVVLSQVTPAVAGMLLDVKIDKTSIAHLQKMAVGEGALR